jgi:hypothetical protein
VVLLFQGWNLGQATDVMVFFTDALAYYPSTWRSTDAYMLRIVRSQQNDGYEPVGRTSSGKPYIGKQIGWSF